MFSCLNKLLMAGRNNAENTQRTEEMQDIKCSVVLQINYFFDRLTEEPWKKLKNGIPDDTTEIQIGELLLNIIITLSRAFFETVKNRIKVSEREVQAALGDMVTQCFRDVLKVEGKVKCKSSKRLNVRICREVAETVNSVPGDVQDLTPRHIPPPRRLCKMVYHAVKMMYVFIAKMNRVYTPRVRRKRTTFSEKLVIVNLDGSDDESSDIVEELEKQENVPSDGQTDKISNVYLEAEILRAGCKTMDPFLVDMSDTQLKTFEHYSSFRKSVPPAVLEEWHRSEGTDVFLQAKLRMFYSVLFVETWLNHILEQLKKNFRNDIKVNCLPLLDMEDIIAKLLMWGNNKPEPNNWEFKFKLMRITQELTNILFRHLTGSPPPEIAPGAQRGDSEGGASGSQSHVYLYNEIRYKVWSFMGLFKYWQNYKAYRVAQETRDRLKLKTSAKPAEDNTEKCSICIILSAIWDGTVRMWRSFVNGDVEVEDYIFNSKDHETPSKEENREAESLSWVGRAIHNFRRGDKVSPLK